jgi:proteasome component ECM29
LNKDLTPLAGKYLNASLAAISDRNVTVRKYFASAIGHLIGIAKEQTVTSLFKKLTTLYFEEQSNKSRAIALTLNAINKKHSDIIKDFAPVILPVIFFAKHEVINEDNKSTVEMFQELWSDIGFPDTLFHAHLNVVVQMLENSLNSQSWILKAQAGNALKTIGQRLDSRLTDEERKRLIDLVLNAIAGRTFDGKEKLVEALAALCPQNATDKEIVNRIVAAILRECRKEEPVYKTKVLKSLGEILEKMEQENRFEDVYNMVFAVLDKQSITDQDSAGTSSGQVANEDRNKDKVVLINLKEVVCETLGKSWPAVKANDSWETQQKYQLMLIEKLTSCFRVNTRPIQVALLIALQKYLEKLHLLNHIEETESKEKKAKSDDTETLHKIVEYVLINVSEASGEFFKTLLIPSI